MQSRTVPFAFRGLVRASIVGVAVMLSSCAGEKQRMGRAYMDAGDYDRAVQAAKDAVASDPQNADYLDLLSDAQTAAADFHFEQGRKLFEERRASESVQELDKALEHMPAHPGANTLRVKADKSASQCRELARKAREAVAREDWEQAALLAHDASEADRSDTAAQELFNHARSALVARHLARAQLALDAGDARACLDACAKAKKWDESNPYLAQLERKAKDAPVRAEAAASPASPPSPQTRPAEIASAVAKPKSPEPAPAKPADVVPEQGKPAATPAPVQAKTAAKAAPPAPVAATPKAQADAAEPAEDTTGATQSSRARQPVRMKDPDAARVPPRLARAGRDPSAPASNERLIEVQPTKRVAAANEQPQGNPPAANLITVERSPSARTQPAADVLPGAGFRVKPGQPGERAKITPIQSASGITSRPAEEQMASPRPVPGLIADAPLQRARLPEMGEAPAARPAPVRKSVQAQVEPQHLFRGALSRDDDRYKKQVTLMDGITVKLRDTDADPLDADFEIIAGKFRVKPDDVPPGGKIDIPGVSGHKYVMTVIWIDDDQETVHFSLDRVE